MIVSSVLSALLLGLFPVSLESPFASVDPLALIDVAPPAAQIDIAHRLSASGAIVIDLKTGQTLFSLQGNVERPMASLTKLMTALLIVEHHDLDTWVPVPQTIAQTKGSLAYLAPGEEYRAGDLLSALLIPSANDAAVTLARFHSGTESTFVEEMNARAKALGLTSTQYANPSGLDDPRQWSTPRDIALLSAYVQRFPEISTRMGRRSQIIMSRQGHALTLTHTHALVLRRDPAILAGKTGTTTAAEQCLVSIVQKGKTEYAVVLLHSMQRYRDMQTILGSLLGPDATTITPVQETECTLGAGAGGGCRAEEAKTTTDIDQQIIPTP
ncbi:MAG: serine hydrolase [Candidatus Peregrinibacteria bacterium]